MQEAERPEIPPIECATGYLTEILELAGQEITEFAALSFVRILIEVNPGIETVLPSPERMFYRVEHEAAYRLAIAAHGRPEALEIVREICSSNIWNGEPVPEPFRAICSSIVKGTFTGPVKRGPKPGQNFGRIFLAVSIAEYLHQAYGIPRTRGDGYEQVSAADVVRDALEVKGLACSYTKIRDWMDHGKHEENRIRAKALSNRLLETYLLDLGLIKSRPNWHIGPYGPQGPFARIGRMT